MVVECMRSLLMDCHCVLAALAWAQVGTGDRSEKIKTYNYKVCQSASEHLAQFAWSRGLSNCAQWCCTCHHSCLSTCLPLWLQDSRVSDHRLKMNFDLNTCLDGGCMICLGSDCCAANPPCQAVMLRVSWWAYEQLQHLHLGSNIMLLHQPQVILRRPSWQW
jgi:hypothetical protein